jgi:hypothetical protein
VVLSLLPMLLLLRAMLHLVSLSTDVEYAVAVNPGVCGPQMVQLLVDEIGRQLEVRGGQAAVAAGAGGPRSGGGDQTHVDTPCMLLCGYA